MLEALMWFLAATLQVCNTLVIWTSEGPQPTPNTASFQEGNLLTVSAHSYYIIDFHYSCPIKHIYNKVNKDDPAIGQTVTLLRMYVGVIHIMFTVRKSWGTESVSQD